MAAALRPRIPWLARASHTDSRASALSSAAHASNVASSRNDFHPGAWQTQKAEAAVSRLTEQHARANRDLTSTQARRSRAALYGSIHASSEHASLVHLPDYVEWAVTHAIQASDRHRLRTDHLSMSAIQDPQVQAIQAAHLPPSRASLLHLATVSPSRYAAILSVLSQVKHRLTFDIDSSQSEQPQVRAWMPDTVIDYDSAAAEGLWASAHAFSFDPESDPDLADASLVRPTSVKRYFGFDRRSHMLKAGKGLTESVLRTPEMDQQASEPKPAETIELDGEVFEAEEQQAPEDEEPETIAYLDGPKPSISQIERSFLSVPLTKYEMKTGDRTLALSAFSLSLMTNDQQRADALERMWDSGANVIVLIDHATRRGFASIGAARAKLLELAAEEGEQAHVLAPCPHDKPCPMLSALASDKSVKSTKHVCSFSTRLASPSFLRRTRHSKGAGEEHVDYSYVVIRRGARPSLEAEAQRRDGPFHENLAQLALRAEGAKTGILDLIRGTQAAAKQRRVLEEVGIEAQIPAPQNMEWPVESDQEAHDELMSLLPDAIRAEMAKAGLEEGTDVDIEQILAQLSTPSHASIATQSAPAPAPAPASTSDQANSADAASAAYEEGDVPSHPPMDEETALAMHLQSFSWSRLIKPPLKKGGHVTFDACAATGDLERFTVPKSYGRQAYQDARKAKWGDLFPHAGKGNVTTRSVADDDDPLAGLFDDDATVEARLNGELPTPTPQTDKIAPTERQIRKAKQRRENKWSSNLNTKPASTSQPPSVLANLESIKTLRRRQSRSNRKPSRGDFDDEIF